MLDKIQTFSEDGLSL